MTAIGSLCTGYGGLDMAVDAAIGGRTAWVSDIARSATHVPSHRVDAPNLGDLKDVDWSTVEPVDILTAGYPCQPFSVAGKRKGADDPRHLWPHIATAIRALRPRLVVLENVSGHLRLGFDAVLADLARLGLDARWAVVRASDVGAPHQRARLFVVALPAADAHGDGLGLLGRLDACARDPHGRRGPHGPGLTPEPATWGPYAAAVHRWGQVVGRPAPTPTELSRRGTPVLSARFVEWLMGVPEGHVTDLASRRDALRLLGNGVVPQQAEHAIRALMPAALEVAA